jgi:hypothetical protein
LELLLSCPKALNASPIIRAQREAVRVVFMDNLAEGGTNWDAEYLPSALVRLAALQALNPHPAKSTLLNGE